MFKKFGAFYNVFRAGQSVADAVGLKNKQNMGNAFAAFLGAAVIAGRLYGIDFGISDEELVVLGSAAATLYGLFNVGATTASTDKIGLVRAKPPVPPAQATADGGLQPVSDTADPSATAGGGPLDGLDTTYIG